MPEDIPQVQVTTSNKTSWRKISLTVLIIIVVSGLIVGAYWFFVLNKDSDTSDLTGPVPKPQIQTSTPSATSSTQKDETANWNTLVNKELNYSIKYPLDWSVKKCSSSDSFGTKEQVQNWPESCQTGAHFTVSVYRSGVFKETVDTSIKTGQAHYINFKSEDTTFAGKTAVKTYGVNKDTPGLEVGVIFNSYYINDEGDKTLVVQYKQNPGSQDYTLIFDKMVSTFKFLD